MQVSIKDWNRFSKEVLVTDGEKNVSMPFKKITKRYGRQYIEYLRAAWRANSDCLTVEEFCEVNGNVPLGFFNKKVERA